MFVKLGSGIKKSKKIFTTGCCVLQIHHKDSSPQKTIEKIQNILESIGFLLKNRNIHWKKPFKNCYSCVLIFSDYPFVHSNGKGMTKEYALASAYGEFIERLQACIEDYFFVFL